MKILLISNMYPSERDGLFGVFVKNFMENMQARDIEFPRIVVIRGKTRNPLVRLLRYIRHNLIASFYGIFTSYDFIYVHFLTHHSPLLLLLGWVFNRTLVINIHGSDIMNYRGNKFLNKLNALALRRCALIVVPSLYFSRVMVQTFPEMPTNKIIVYPSGGVNRQIFKESTSNPKQHGRTLRMALTSRIDDQKGWDVFIKAILALKLNNHAVDALIIGQGAAEEQMHALIDRLDLRNEVKFLGLLSQDKIAAYYRDIDIFIFPTLLPESLGLVGLEAMACGLPVIASAIGAPAHYVVSQKNGFLFEPGNVQDLTNKISSYIAMSSAEKRRMAEMAVSTAAFYDSDQATMILKQRLRTLQGAEHV